MYGEEERDLCDGETKRAHTSTPHTAAYKCSKVIHSRLGAVQKAENRALLERDPSGGVFRVLTFEKA